MALNQVRNPRTVYLGGGAGAGGRGGYTPVDEFATTGTPIPGMLAETYNDGGVTKWRAHSTSAGLAQKAFYLELIYNQQTIDTPYAAGELALVGVMHPGAKVYALVPSGQDINADDFLESNGDGYLKSGTTNPVAKALESVGAVTALTRVRVEVL